MIEKTSMREQKVNSVKASLIQFYSLKHFELVVSRNKTNKICCLKLVHLWQLIN